MQQYQMVYQSNNAKVGEKLIEKERIESGMVF